MILICEDDDDVAALIAASCRTLGRDWLRVARGEDAVRYVQDNPALSLLILDIVLVGTNGNAALAQIRTLPSPRGDVPVLFLTGGLVPLTVPPNGAASAYIQKPFLPPALEAAIAELARTRGERNNNPGNIERGPIRWAGMAEDQSGDPRFLVFDSSVMGVRAIMRILMRYGEEGIFTLSGIVGRWAPASENDTAAYLHHMVRSTGVMPGEELTMRDPPTLEALARGIIEQENGRCRYDKPIFAEAAALALAPAV